MNCQQCEELIGSAVDGMLTLAERIRLDTHLADCVACRAAWGEYHALAQLARRWTPQAGVTDANADVFMAQVLARITAQPAPKSAPLWRPLVVMALLAAILVLLPRTFWPVLPSVSVSVHDLSHWLLANGRALPGEMAAAWNTGITVPSWGWSALLALGVANALFYARVAQSQRRSLS